MGRSTTMAPQRKAFSGPAVAPARPSAYDRFPSGARNMWLDELQAKIEGAFNPPASPGPSRSPSPLEEEPTSLGVAQDLQAILDAPSSQGDSMSDGLEEEDEEEQEEDEDDGEEEDDAENEDGHDGEYVEDDFAEEDDFHDHDDEITPQTRHWATRQPLAHEQAHEEEDEELEQDDYEEDEEDEGIEDVYQDRISPSKRPRLEDDDLFAQGLMDPRLVNGEQWGGEQHDPNQAETLAQPLSYPHDADDEEEDDVMYVGDTDEEEDEYEEEEEDVEEDELDDDGMGGDDLKPGTFDAEAVTPALGLDDEVYGSQGTQESNPIGAEAGQVMSGSPTVSAADAHDAYGLQDTQGAMADSQATSFDNMPMAGSLYPTLPVFSETAAPANEAITPASSSLYPALSSLPQIAFDNDMIDPSLLADFAQRVEAQASGDLGGTTEAQNTSEMTALADAVINNYHADNVEMAVPLEREEVSSFQHGMGENEQDGYEEDHDSESEEGLENTPAEVTGDRRDISSDQAEDEEEADYDDEDSESQDDSSEGDAASSPNVVSNTQEEAIEILSSDDEEDDEAEEEVESQDNDDFSEDEQNSDRDIPSQDAILARSAIGESSFPGRESTVCVSTRPTSAEAYDVQYAYSGGALNDDEVEEPTEIEVPTGTHIRFESNNDAHVSVGGSGAQMPSSPPVQAASESIDLSSLDHRQPGSTQHDAIGSEEEEEEYEATQDGPATMQPHTSRSLPFQNLHSAAQDHTSAIAIDTTEPSVAIEETIIDEPTELGGAMEVDEQYEVEIEEPVSRGPSVPLVTPAVELPLEATFMASNEPEAGIDAIVRAIIGDPEVEEAIAEAEYVYDDSEPSSRAIEVGSVSEATDAAAENEIPEEMYSIPAGIEQSAETIEIDTLVEDIAAPDLDAGNSGLDAGITVIDDDMDIPPAITDNAPADDMHSIPIGLEQSAETNENSTPTQEIPPVHPDEADSGPAKGLTIIDDDKDILSASSEPEGPVAIEADASVGQATEALPDPYGAPPPTDNIMPEVPFHRSRTPSLVVEPPPNPPYPELVIEQVANRTVSPFMLRQEDPIPDSHTELATPPTSHQIRPRLDRAPSTMLVNVEEVDMMLDFEPNTEREDTPVDFPDPAEPAPTTELQAPIEPQDLSPRLKPRSASTEAIAPAENEEVVTADLISTVTVTSREDSPVLFPVPGEPAPYTDILSPLDVHHDLPLVVGQGGEAAPSLCVEPPSEPVTGPPSPSGSTKSALQADHLTMLSPDAGEGDIQRSPKKALASSSDLDAPSALIAPDHAVTDTDAEAESSSQAVEFMRLPSPLRHRHGPAPRQASVPPSVSTRTTRAHARRSSAAPEALHPPVTRQNCHYRKLYMVEGDMSATVLVPQCTLTEHEKLEEEHAEDRGEPTRAEEAKARDQPISESHLRLHISLTAKLHRIVGLGIFDEEGKTYLLQANDAALLADHEVEPLESSSVLLEAPADSSTRSPVKPRRSKRLSEAPSETGIREESVAASHRSVSLALAATPVAEEDANMADGEGYKLRSKSEMLPEASIDDSDIGTERGDEVVVEALSDRDRTATPSLKREQESHASPTRYSLRSRGPDPDDGASAVGESLTASARAPRSKTRTVTPSASAEPQTTSAITPMTTRRRARESVMPTDSLASQAAPPLSPSAPPTTGRSKGKGKAKADDIEQEDKDEVAEPITPSKAKSSHKKGKSRQADSKYVPDDGDENDSETSSTYILPHNDSPAGTGTGTGKKKRKMGSISSRGNESPWKLDQQDRHEPASPSISQSSRIKRRAVASKEEPDVPVPEGSEANEGMSRWAKLWSWFSD